MKHPAQMKRSKSQPKLSLEKAALLMLGLGTVAVMGIPGLGPDGAPRGPVEGLVRDADGNVLAQAEVALFDDATLALVEITATDEAGRFVFHQEPERYHILATQGQRATDRTLVAGWALDRQRSAHSGVEIKLQRGQAACVSVEDTQGQPVAGAEVRVLDASGEAVVVDRLLTDDTGEVTFLSPPEAHFAVFPPDGSAVRWILNAGSSTESGASSAGGEKRFRVRLLPTATTQGFVTDVDGQSLPEVVVSAWNLEDEDWAGWTKTDATGRFSLATSMDPTLLRIVDPSHGFLSTEILLSGRTDTPLAIRLPKGGDLEVLAGSGAEGQPARVWIWSEETLTWSWGQLTSDTGHVSTIGSEHIGVVAYPLDEDEPRFEVWGVERDDSVLQLER